MLRLCPVEPWTLVALVALVGKYEGLVGKYEGLVGKYEGLVGKYEGLVGEYEGLVGVGSLYEALMGI